MTTLPAASADALATSQSLVHAIQAEIRQQGGWIPFSRYMELALYAPGLGYYAAGSHKLGAAGDFTTAPEMSALFGRALARQLAELLPQTANVIYEFGAGTGKLAIDILGELQALDALPERYCIVDLSPDLIERQQHNIRQALPQLADRVQWLSQLPERLDGVIIGNEVLDAMPCELIRWSPEAQQRGVALDGERFVWEDRPIQDPQLLQLARAIQPQHDDYVSEISPANIGFLHTLAQKLERGAILLLDYGFPAAEYYHPQRHMGTLIGHYRHHTVDDPFFLPGLMDLTCHVDFSAMAQAGIDAGLDLIGYTTQAQFLINAGITQLLEQLDPADAAGYLPHAAAVQKLLSPSEMGELFKAIGFGKNVSIDWSGFLRGDRCYTL
ncbi:class I SAM-dependent methyltransferase [Chromobacterium aquaticum]|uniref:Class I SAM-dependent methyltransferase n=1 Tax=Chromobacterium aquaticum TaxID=467180 RepID=A0ABV8ZWN6_9NEIS|nr:class I SAM-dependent methyltransferase [Chromobacterium aquaticum]MCD5363722.1 class I SAM-dependent methyltransferase [Chromobacterium aquaticum]